MTTYHVDPTQPTDLGANPPRVQTGQELRSLLVDGDTVLFLRGYNHDGSGLYNFISAPIQRNSITIGDYGSLSEAKPFLDARSWEPPGASGWVQARTTEGVTIWKKLLIASPTAGLKRLWTGAKKTGDGLAIGSRIEGLSRGRNPSQKGGTIYDIDDTWTLANESTILDRLYMAYYDYNRDYGGQYTRVWASIQDTGTSGVSLDRVTYIIVPSTNAADTPPNWYDGLAFLQPSNSGVIGEGSSAGLRFRDADNCVVQNINSSGVASAIDWEPPRTKNCTNWLVEGCEATLWWSRGIQASGQSASGSVTYGPYGLSDVKILSNLADSKPTEDEQDPKTAAGWFSGSESIEVASYTGVAGVYGVKVRYNTVFGLQHNGINVLGAGTNVSGVTHTGVMQDVDVSFNNVEGYDYMTDTRGCAITGTSGGNNHVYGNVFRNQCVKSEFSGDVKVTGNWWIKVRPSVSQSANQCAVRIGPLNPYEAPTIGLEFAYNQILECQTMLTHFVASGAVDIVTGAVNYHDNIGQMIGGLTNIAFKFSNSGASGAIQPGGITMLRNAVERDVEPIISWRVTGTSANDENDSVTGGPNPATPSIVYTDQTWDTRRTPAPASLYPPSLREYIW